MFESTIADIRDKIARNVNDDDVLMDIQEDINTLVDEYNKLRNRIADRYERVSIDTDSDIFTNQMTFDDLMPYESELLP